MLEPSLLPVGRRENSAAWEGESMRLADLRARMAEHLGASYAPVWATMQVLAELDGRTVDEAVAAGTPTKHIWRAVWAYLELADRER